MKKLLTLALFTLAGLSAWANAQDSLHTAIKQCNLPAIQAAIDSGANIHYINDEGETPISMAFFCPDAVAMLLKMGADPEAGDYPLMARAAEYYAYDVMAQLVDFGMDVNVYSEGYQATPLQIVLKETNCVPCLNGLLGEGAQYDFEDGNAMHLVAEFSATYNQRFNEAVLKTVELQKQGYDVPVWFRNLDEQHNFSELAMFMTLQQKNVFMNLHNNEGMTPLCLALRKGNTLIAKGLVKEGANPRLESVNEYTGITYHPICQAAQFNDAALVQAMIEGSADVNATVSSHALNQIPEYEKNGELKSTGYTPLIIAIMNGQFEIADILLDNGADLTMGSSGTGLVLVPHWEFEWMDREFYCPVSFSNKTPIYWAIEHNNIDLLQRIAESVGNNYQGGFSIQKLNLPVPEEVNPLTGLPRLAHCPSFSSKQKPSTYARDLDNEAFGDMLEEMGM